MPVTVSDMVLKEFTVILMGSRNNGSLHTRKMLLFYNVCGPTIC